MSKETKITIGIAAGVALIVATIATVIVVKKRKNKTTEMEVEETSSPIESEPVTKEEQFEEAQKIFKENFGDSEPVEVKPFTEEQIRSAEETRQKVQNQFTQKYLIATTEDNINTFGATPIPALKQNDTDWMIMDLTVNPRIVRSDKNGYFDGFEIYDTFEKASERFRGIYAYIQGVFTPSEEQPIVPTSLIVEAILKTATMKQIDNG